MDESENRPCPFFGEHADVTGVQISAFNGDFWTIACGTCGAEGPNKITEAEAIKAWNTRHDDALNSVLSEILEWQDATFPDRTIGGLAAHLLEEAGELEESPSDPIEVADVIMLAVCLAKDLKMDLPAVLRAKLEINKARKWSKATGGYSKHENEGQ